MVCALSAGISCTVEAEREPYLECYEVSGLVKVGEFHSHGRIPAFFSATDDEDETFPGLYGVVSCGDDRKVYRAVLGADKQIFLTEEQMKTVVYDSDEDRLSWVLGWFHQVYNKSIGNGSYYIVLVGQEKTKAIYVPSYEMARFFEGIFHVYSIDRGPAKRLLSAGSSFSDLSRGAYLEKRRSFAVWMWLC